MAQRLKGNDNVTLGGAAARLVNATIINLVLRSTDAPGSVRYFFDVGIFGYGYDPERGMTSVTSILPGYLGELSLCDLPTLAKNPLRVDVQEQSGHAIPVWLDPAHGGRTPMCQVFEKIGSHLAKWAAIHPESSPPVVINISDGLVTDNPYDGTDLEGWLDRLSTIRTAAGVVKVFDIALSSDVDHPVLRPAVITALTYPGWTVAQVSRIVSDVQVSTWTSIPALSSESDYTAQEFLQRAELADDTAHANIVREND
jgi:hypothetical protein